MFEYKGKNFKLTVKSLLLYKELNESDYYKDLEAAAAIFTPELIDAAQSQKMTKDLLNLMSNAAIKTFGLRAIPALLVDSEYKTNEALSRDFANSDELLEFNDLNMFMLIFNETNRLSDPSNSKNKNTTKKK